MKFTFILFFAVSLFFPAGAFAAWPERPVKVLLGSAAGSSIDMVGRVIAQKLSEKFGQPFVPQNVAGGGLGAFAMTLKNAKADGYTIGFGTDANFTNNVHDPNAQYKLEDFKPLCTVFNGDTSYICAADKPWKDLKDALEWSADNGPIIYLFQTMIDRKAMELRVSEVPGAQVKYMPAASPSALVSSLLGGHGDLGFSGGLHYEQARAGKIRTLTMATSEKSPNYPDVPMMLDIFPNAAPSDAYRVIVVKADFPSEAKVALEAALKEIILDPEFKALVEDKLHYVVRYNDATATEAIFQTQFKDFTRYWQ